MTARIPVGSRRAPGPSGTADLGPVSVTPDSGTGSSQTFASCIADPKGYSALSMVRVIVNNTLARDLGVLFPVLPGQQRPLSGKRCRHTGWVGSIILGQTGTLQNSQCAVNTAASSVVGQRQQPDPECRREFPGRLQRNQKHLHGCHDRTAHFRSGSRKGLDVGGRGRNDGAGIGDAGFRHRKQPDVQLRVCGPPRFFRTVDGESDLRQCALGSGSVLLPILPGQQSHLPGGRCSVSVGRQSVAGASRNFTKQPVYGECRDVVGLGSGNNLTLNVAISFQPGFTGAKNIYMDASDGASSSGWQQKGAWTPY